jgi:hypothetical protein
MEIIYAAESAAKKSALAAAEHKATGKTKYRPCPPRVVSGELV